jgi:hypothetical protein
VSIELQARVKCDRCEAVCVYWVPLPTADSCIESGGLVSTSLEVSRLPAEWARVGHYTGHTDLCPTCVAIEAEDKRHAEEREKQRLALARKKRKAKKEAARK